MHSGAKWSYERAMEDKAFDLIRDTPILETQAGW